MAPSKLLARNVRPQRPVDDFEEEDVEGEDFDSASEGAELDDGGDSAEGSADEKEDEGEDNDGGAAEQQMANVSFGALKQAQDSLSRKRKRGKEGNADQDEKLEKLKARLQQIKKNNATDESSSKKPKTKSSKVKVKVTQNDDDEDGEHGSDSDSDSAPSEQGANTSRSSKHAPGSQSTRYQVTRKRTVIDVPKHITRDPRFDAIHGEPDNPNAAKAYSFIRDYEESEIAELKAALRKTKNEDEKEVLRRNMVAMQNRHKAKDAAARQQEVLRKHRKEERERIGEGKTPYYLKDKEVKERALVEKYNSMKAKDRQKAVDKKRKKEGQKEKKRMPNMRRMVD